MNRRSVVVAIVLLCLPVCVYADDVFQKKGNDDNFQRVATDVVTTVHRLMGDQDVVQWFEWDAKTGLPVSRNIKATRGSYRVDESPTERRRELLDALLAHGLRATVENDSGNTNETTLDLYCVHMTWVIAPGVVMNQNAKAEYPKDSYTLTVRPANARTARQIDLKTVAGLERVEQFKRIRVRLRDGSSTEGECPTREVFYQGLEGLDKNGQLHQFILPGFLISATFAPAQ